MVKSKKNSTLERVLLPKSPSGISGLDEITGGGLPKGRPTLVCGAAGCGKTLLSMEFLVRGATQYNEPGVFMSFEEKSEEVATNVASLGFDLNALAADKKIALEYVHIERNEIEETGEYDLEALFIRLGYAIDSVKAKRVVLDTIETLFSGLSNTAILRAELKRLFQWLKDKGVTAIITGERGEGQLTRNGLEEYVSDCVILLDHRVSEQFSTRRLRIVKYRGSTHGTNEYPFLIDENGISIIPITSIGLTHEASTERVSTGIPKLDAMFGGDNKSYYRGSSVLVSGTSGTGKSSLAAHFAYASCKRGEKVLYFSFEESGSQIIRNMKSIGMNLELYVQKGLLNIHSVRPTLHGLEMHLAIMHKIIAEFDPQIVVVDPINNLLVSGSSGTEVRVMLVKLVDFLKMRQITALFTSLTSGGDEALEYTDVGLSSIIDTWILLREIAFGGERNRVIYILKSRGMPHSNQIREFVFTDKGIDLLDVYLGPGGLTGSARLSQELREAEQVAAIEEEIQRQQLILESKRKAFEAQVVSLKMELQAQQADIAKLIVNEQVKQKKLAEDRKVIAGSRKAIFSNNEMQGKK